MHSAAAQILETALALQRAPGERFRLRERPLPDGLIHMLEVASGSPQALEAAATKFGATESDLLEAARFYLEQVLFAAPHATAYRILGVAPEASIDLIRSHHRWLQRWLHPDRALAGDASVYATRVNQAWSILRTPESRHRYDVQLAEARMAGAAAPLPLATVRRWEHADLAPTPGRQTRWLVGAALLACAVLAVLVVRHEQGPEPWSPGDGEVIAAVDEAPTDQPAIDDRDLGIFTEAMALATNPSPVDLTHGRLPLPVPAPALVPAPEAAPLSAPLPVEVVQAATLSLVAPPVAAPSAKPLPEPQAAPVPVAIQVGASVAPAREVVTQPEPSTVILDRMKKAEARVAQVTAYLAAQPGAAPLWNDLKAAQDAERIRNRIAASQGTALDLATPNWQLQRDNATLSVDYRCNQCRVRHGRLDVQLIWREDLWLVRGIGLAPST